MIEYLKCNKKTFPATSPNNKFWLNKLFRTKNAGMLNKNEQENKKAKGQEETSPALTVMTCGVNPMPADPANRKQITIK